MRELKRLARAIDKEDLPLLQQLIEQGVALDVPLSDGRCPLAAAAVTGNVDLVRLLLEAGADVNGVSGPNADTALSLAADRGLEQIVRTLVDAKADVNKENKIPLSPLQLAASGDSLSHINTVRILVEAGADLNRGKGSTPLMCACYGLKETVRLLLDAGADVNAVRPAGTALHIAVEKNNAEVVNLLLERGANVNLHTLSQSSYPNLTALELARRLNRRQIIPLLEAASAALPTEIVQPGTTTLQPSWAELRTWLRQMKPELAASFRKPSTNNRIAKLQERVGQMLPDSFKRCYLTNDGQEDNAPPLVPPKDFLDSGYRLLPIREMLGDWSMLNDLLDRGEFEGETITPDKGVRQDWWNPGWLPFAGDGHGDYLCLDFVPTPEGTKGQIISMSHETGRREFLAPSFEVWLGDLIESLQQGSE